MSVKAHLPISHPFVTNGNFDDGNGYFNYLEASSPKKRKSNRANAIRCSLENLVHVYYKREKLSWPDMPKHRDTLNQRIAHLTGAEIVYNKIAYRCPEESLLPRSVVEYEHIKQSFSVIRDIANGPSHHGNDLLVSDTDLQSALLLLERFITWYFKRYEIDIASLTATVRRLYSPQISADHESGCIHVDSTYWHDLAVSSENDAISIKQNFYLKADERLSHKLLALEASDNHENHFSLNKKIIETFHKNGGKRDDAIRQIVNDSLSQNCTILIKIFAPSGEGKTVFLSQIAYEYAQLPNICKTYVINSVNEYTSEYIEDEIQRSNNVPLLFLIDTPSTYSEYLNKDFSFLRDWSYKSIVFIVADQRDRFKHKLQGEIWEDSFENFFSEVYQVDYKLQQSEREEIFDKLIKAVRLRDDLTKDTEITLKSIYYLNPQLTSRERLFKVSKHLGQSFTIKHNHDWEIWRQLTNQPSFIKYRDLFTFVSVFAYLEIPLSIDIFNVGYLPGINRRNVVDFVKGNSEGGLIRIIEDKLYLRHEQVAQWYFEHHSHIDVAKDVLSSFFLVFEEKLDPLGCYLFRNINSPLEKNKKLGGLNKEQKKEIFIKYYETNKFSDPDMPKVLTELAKLEDYLEDKIKWLDEAIKNFPGNWHTRTFKAQLFISAGKFDDAQNLLNELFILNKNIAWSIMNQFRLDVKADQVLDASKYIALAQNKHDYYLALLQIGKAMQRIRAAIPMAIKIFNYLKEKEPNNPLALMSLAHIYRRRRTKHDNALAIAELNNILNNNPKDIPARLLLTDMYIYDEAFDKAEKNLIEGINYVPGQIALTVRLVQLYRENKHFINDSVSKAGDLLEKAFSSFSLSMQLRTEYAKWCYGNFDTKEMHQKAINILKETIRLYSLHIHSRTELGIIYQRSRFFRDLNASVSVLKECMALDLDRKEVPFRVVLGESLMLIDTLESWHSAKEILEDAKTINEHNKATYIALMKLYRHFTDEDKLSEVIKAIETFGERDSRIFTVHAQAFLKKGKIDEALKTLNAALAQDEDNYYLLSQVGNILLNYAANPKLNESAPSEQRVNSLLLHAEEYFLKSLKVFPNNEITLHSLIQLYDSLQYDKYRDPDQYDHAITNRNNRLMDLYSLNENNIYLSVLLGKMFQFSFRPRLSIYFLEKAVNYTKTIEEKLKVLTQLKEAYKIFNSKRIIEDITVRFNYETQNSGDFQKEIAAFKKYEFAERGNYKLVQIHNVGNISLTGQIVKTTLQTFNIVQDASKKVHKSIEENDQVYFATFDVNGHVLANNIEPYFDTGALRLEDLLPYKINAFTNLKRKFRK
jgi:tetratricopeptide (TPR) repeat protein